MTDASNSTSNTALVDLSQLAAHLEQFADERDWAQFHSPKNLVMALTGEVGELNEIFQWMPEEASKAAGQDPQTARAVQDEIADVLLYLVRLSSVLGVDLNAAVQQKLKANALRYPADKVRGSSKKHSRPEAGESGKD
ncbi:MULTISPECIES: nucleotide pyrophosphohydrolase [Variovorax]|jgi:dCTP diphosphatase|uniref:nucleotide pyrophosphohydrolase n=1 Tax=Variovorax TaxID=34072 RepID=UPI000869409A|nr:MULTISPECIES: nucleotide pyrophosphohydrolase [Variovorax]MBN8757275.1 nucleotide pyrophosphohydrolase [Variovorax sp.]ODU18007.1 MAG: nucleotide pyrophosphohydrolase [Variovorax sp. SCN 67-85]ODV24541.1 MAG: nucleotide pyrophosphohydrolase [Variovorax sp. SCN 67-20]OJZ13519.1 MAG: nucleotide pyrophosphohydrolase [Variovorax sp. 67-131]UKI06165.1 nucleotide pyrophosphohydrolase [Variovorax paradoxus]